jgi:hypothetical protein
VAPEEFLAALRPVLDALGARVVGCDEMTGGDVPIALEGRVIGGARPVPLHGALRRVIEVVERELGGPLPSLSRTDKQAAIRMLDERGAFVLRRAVEDVADAMGVSRITVYNYLNALHR